MPGRALGLAWFAIDEAAHKLDVAIDAPAQDAAAPADDRCRSISPASRRARRREVTVAAVDVGILNLTGFKTPDPSAYFFGQRKLPVEIRDLYGMLIDGMQGAAGAIHTGGDGSGGLEGNLPTQAPLALFSGVVKVDGRGRTRPSLRPAGLQRLGARDGGRLVEGQGRLGAGRRDRARSRRRHRDAAALPRSRRPLAKCMSTSTTSKARRATTSSISTFTVRSRRTPTR